MQVKFREYSEKEIREKQELAGNLEMGNSKTSCFLDLFSGSHQLLAPQDSRTSLLPPPFGHSLSLALNPPRI